MIDLLSRLEPRRLLEGIGHSSFRSVEALVPAERRSVLKSDTRMLARLLLGLRGYELLHSQRIRGALFELLNPKSLAGLAGRFAGRSFAKPADNALALAATEWNSRSTLVPEVARLLRIPDSYLPKPGGAHPTVEVIDPISLLPPLHAYQSEVREVLTKALSSGVDAVLLQMPTGSGKTRTVVEALVEWMGSHGVVETEDSLVWVAHSEELCEQAIESFQEVWEAKGVASLRTVRCWSTHSPEPGVLPGSAAFVTFQKLTALERGSSRLLGALRSCARVVVIDEAHKLLAPTYKSAVAALREERAATLLGLTATPGRGLQSDSENEQLASLFGKNLLSPSLGANPIQRLREIGILSMLSREVLQTGIEVNALQDEELPGERAGDLPVRVLRQLARSVPRNRLILTEIQRHVGAGNPCLVFTCSVSHSRLLAASLTMRGIAAAYVDSGTRRGARREIVERFRSGACDVLLNFSVLSTGFDAPGVKTVVVTRPTSSVVLYSQMIGRGLRGPRMGGSKVCNLIDVRDNIVAFGGIEEVYGCFSEYWS